MPIVLLAPLLDIRSICVWVQQAQICSRRNSHTHTHMHTKVDGDQGKLTNWWTDRESCCFPVAGMVCEAIGHVLRILSFPPFSSTASTQSPGVPAGNLVHTLNQEGGGKEAYNRNAHTHTHQRTCAGTRVPSRHQHQKDSMWSARRTTSNMGGQSPHSNDDSMEDVPPEEEVCEGQGSGGAKRGVLCGASRRATSEKSPPHATANSSTHHICKTGNTLSPKRDSCKCGGEMVEAWRGSYANVDCNRSINTVSSLLLCYGRVRTRTIG